MWSLPAACPAAFVWGLIFLCYFLPFFTLRSQICIATCFAVMLTISMVISTAFRPICNHEGLTSCPDLVKFFQNLTTFHALELETSQGQEERGWEGGKAG